MGIYERMAGVEAPKLPVHTFTAACAEVARGGVSANTASQRLSLNAQEKQEANTLIGRVQGGQITRELVEDVLLLLEVTFYSVSEAKTRLGV